MISPVTTSRYTFPSRDYLCVARHVDFILLVASVHDHDEAVVSGASFIYIQTIVGHEMFHFPFSSGFAPFPPFVDGGDIVVGFVLKLGAPLFGESIGFVSRGNRPARLS